MVRQMKLRGQIRRSPEDGTFTFISQLYDGTTFDLPVGEFDIELNGPFRVDDPVVDGWLFVIQEAQQADRCYLTLPKPTLVYGKQVLVNELQLSPLGLKLADFKPKKSGGEVTQKLVQSQAKAKAKAKKKSDSKGEVSPVQ